MEAIERLQQQSYKQLSLYIEFFPESWKRIKKINKSFVLPALVVNLIMDVTFLLS